MIKKGFKIGKNRTTMDLIIKRIKKRGGFLSNPIIDWIGNLKVVMYNIFQKMVFIFDLIDSKKIKIEMSIVCPFKY